LLFVSELGWNGDLDSWEALALTESLCLSHVRAWKLPCQRILPFIYDPWDSSPPVFSLLQRYKCPRDGLGASDTVWVGLVRLHGCLSSSGSKSHHSDFTLHGESQDWAMWLLGFFFPDEA